MILYSIVFSFTLLQNMSHKTHPFTWRARIMFL